MAEYPGPVDYHPYEYPYGDEPGTDCVRAGCLAPPGAGVHDPSMWESEPKAAAPRPRIRFYLPSSYSLFDMMRLLLLAGLLVALGIGDSWLAVHA